MKKYLGNASVFRKFIIDHFLSKLTLHLSQVLYILSQAEKTITAKTNTHTDKKTENRHSMLICLYAIYTLYELKNKAICICVYVYLIFTQNPIIL